MKATRTPLLAVAGALLVATGCASRRGPEPPLGLTGADRTQAQALAHFAQGLIQEHALEGDPEAALASFRKAVEADPFDQDLWLQVARILLELERPLEADEVLSEGTRRLPSSAALHLARGRLAGWQDDHARAAELFERGAEVATDPDLRAEAWSLAAIARSRQGDDEGVRAALERFLALSGEPRAEPADAASDGQPDDRIRVLHLALDLAGDLLRSGDTERAGGLVRWAVDRARTHEERADLWHLFGQAAWRAGEPGATRHALLATAREDPIRFWAVLQAFEIELGDTPESSPPDRSNAVADAVLRRADASPEDPSLLIAAAVIHRDRGRPAEALQVFNKALRRLRESDVLPDPPPTAYTILLSGLLADNGDTDAAETALRDVLRHAPDDPLVLNNLAYLLAEQGRELDEAEQLVRRALDVAPDVAAFLDTLGWIHYQRGEFEDALRWLALAVVRKPESAIIQDHLGDALAQLGREREAVIHWSQSYRLDPANATVADKLTRHGVDPAALLEDRPDRATPARPATP